MQVRFRYDHYETKGLLFEQVQSQIIHHKLNERLWGLFIELLRFVSDLFDNIDIMALYEKIIHEDKTREKLNAIFRDDYKTDKAA